MEAKHLLSKLSKEVNFEKIVYDAK
jgi:hypothetical protein